MDKQIQQLLNEASKFYRSGQLQKAEKTYQQILNIEPNQDHALHLLGLIEHHKKQTKNAIGLIKQAISISPKNPIYRDNLATILSESGMYKEALTLFQQAINLEPTNGMLWNNLANALLKLGKKNMAEEMYLQALKMQPENYLIQNNLAALYQKNRKFYKSQKLLEQVVSAKSDFYQGHYNLAVSFYHQADFENALHYLNVALSIKPDHADSLYQKSLIYLAQGLWHQANEIYFSRFYKFNPAKLSVAMTEKVLLKPHLNTIKNKKIMVLSEQGLSEQIIFSRFLKLIKADSAQLIVECDERLLNIYQHSFKDITFITKDKIHDHLVDYYVPICSLMSLYYQQINEQENKKYGLMANDAKTLREQYSQFGKPLVGISWGTRNNICQQYALTLSDLTKLLEDTEANFISLQYNVDPYERSLLQQKIHFDKEIDQTKNLQAALDQIAAMDLVITIDNTIAIMACAVGTPCWLLLHKVPTFIWGSPTNHMLWFDNARLFRQQNADDWDEPVAQANAALRSWIKLFNRDQQ